MKNPIKSIKYQPLAILFFVLISSALMAQDFSWAVANLGGTNEPKDIAVDNMGNVIVLSRLFQSTTDFDPGAGTQNLTTTGEDMIVQKLDANGNLIWVKQFSDDFQADLGMQLDDAGNIYITGAFIGTTDFDPNAGTANLTATGSSDMFVLKLDPSGSFVWVKNMGGNDFTVGHDIAVNAAGQVHVVGRFRGTTDFDPGTGVNNLTAGGTGIYNSFIVKLNTNGDFLWAGSAEGNQSNNAYGISLDASGNVYVVGSFVSGVDLDPGAGTNSFTSFAGSSDGYILKLDNSGTHQWAKQVGGTAVDGAYDIITNSNGDSYILGEFRGDGDFDPGLDTVTLANNGFSDAFVLKLDINGNFVWANSIGGTGGDVGDDLAFDASENLLILGRFSNTVDFDPGSGTFNISSVGTQDSYLQKLTPSGDMEWTLSYQTDGFGLFTGIPSVATQGVSIVSTGFFSNTNDLDPTAGTFNLTANGFENLYVQKLSECITTTSSVHDTACFSYTSPSGKYTWTNSNTYADTLTNQHGCDSIITIHLVVNDIDKTVTSTDTSIIANASSASFQWLDCNNGYAIIPGETSAALLAPPVGNYAVAVTANGCVDTSDCRAFTFLTDCPDFKQLQKIVANDRTEGSNFGSSVDIFKNYVVVGAERDDYDISGGNPISFAGSAYVFEIDQNGSVIEKQKLVASDRFEFDRFGRATSISDEWLAVGSANNTGQVYIFKRNSNGVWAQTQKLTASDSSNADSFGYSVSISDNTILVGAQNEDEDTTGANSLSSAGSAYVFELDGNGIWNETQKLVASDRDAGDFFGFAVSLDENTAFIAAPLDSVGSTYVFERDTNGIWSEKQKLVLTNTNPKSRFGHDLSLSGNYAIISSHFETELTNGGNDVVVDAGAAYIFERNANGIWVEAQRIVASSVDTNQYFGLGVSLSGNTTIIAAPHEERDANGENDLDDAGAAYIFTRCENGIWEQKQKVVASNRGTYDYFGDEAVANYGQYAIVGFSKDDDDANGADSIQNAGSAYIYKDFSCEPSFSSFPVTQCFNYTVPSGDEMYTAGGTYIVMDTIPNSCGNDSIMTITLTIDTVDTSVSSLGLTLISNATGASYRWLNCSNFNVISGETAASYTATANGEYAVEVTINGCTDTSSCIAAINVGVTENPLLENVSIFPIPNDGKVTVDFGALKEVSIQVKTLTGQVLYEKRKLSNSPYQFEFNKAAGIYIIELSTAQGEKQQYQFIKR